MYSIVSTAIIRGINSQTVCVEADVSNGMPMFEMVGFLASEVREARERVRTALRNSGYALPVKRITVNLSPANIKKTGSGFDLPVAVAILAALGIVPRGRLAGMLIIGEISLDGSVQPVGGILPVVAEAEKNGFTHCIVPYKNRQEARMIRGVGVVAVQSIVQAVAYLKGEWKEPDEANPVFQTPENGGGEPDFSEINGQYLVRRASEVAAAGMHNFLMLGPPGAGKTMLARRIPTILPPMCAQEELEVAKVYSVCGLLQGGLLHSRPFRSPHHTVTPQGLVGGGIHPRPGEISLAHKGVLFLDELAEFAKPTLELLRQPLEDRKISLARLQGSYCYPADFMLVAAMNPCPCGAYPDMNRCTCTQSMIDRYLGKISQPLLDRMDICVEAAPLSYDEVTAQGTNESSASIRARVCAAWDVQRMRFAGESVYFNSQIPAMQLKAACLLGAEQEAYLKETYAKLGLTARAYHKLLRVARTIADLEGSERVRTEHLMEAVCYRSLDKKYWERG